MAGEKEIELRLRSVHNTKKITYAMKLVAAAKLRKAQEAVQKSRAYTTALSGLLGQLGSNLTGDESHPLLTPRESVRKIQVVVIGGARGLCGGYNADLRRKVEALYKELAASNPQATITATLLGRKPAEYFRRVGKSVVRTYETLPEDAAKWPIEDIAAAIEGDFLSADADEIYIVFTRFKSALTQTPVAERLLPLDTDVVTATKHSTQIPESSASATNALFEPSAKDVFTAVIPRILRTKILQAALDAKASETGSRMTAMDAATKNAGDLIKSLTRLKNKLRQGRVTSQLLDIVGGAEATS